MGLLLTWILSATALAFDPLEGLSQKEICSADELLLMRYSFETIQRDFKLLCCTAEGLGETDDRCMMDWPFNDVPSCKAYDVMRNRIFARYGYAFQSEEWSRYFASVPWYKARSDYSEQWVSETAKQNAVTLKKFATEKTGCMD